MRRATSTNRLGMILAVAATFASAGRATIYQWEYIDPNNPGLGKQPSTTPTVGGQNLTAAPNTFFNNADLTLGYLIGANVQGSLMANVKLTLADLTNADLSNAKMENVTWTNATLTGATLRGAYIGFATTKGLTAAQFYTTGSYQSDDLASVKFGYNDLSGWSFAGKNLTGADLSYPTHLASANLSNANLTNADLEDTVLSNANLSNATLMNANLEDVTTTNANFAGADIRGARFRTETAAEFSSAQLYSTASYQAGDLSGIQFNFSNLSGWNFAGQNLTNGSFSNVTFTGANLAGANIQGARFASGGTYGGISFAQFASTASYQTKNLQGIRLTLLVPNAGWSFVGQNLTGASLGGGTLQGVDFRDANLTNATLSGSVVGANFTGAEVRGADFNNEAWPSAGQFYSTKNYQQRDLTGFDFSGKNVALWSFANQDLTFADFSGAFLADAVFTGAKIRNINLNNAHTVAAAQIYSTASYQTGDLRGVRLGFDMADWNFAGKDLTYASFGSLALVNFQGARLVGASFGTTANVNFTGADARGASSSIISGTNILTNTIRPNGRVEGLNLTASRSLTVRNFVEPIEALKSIKVGGQFTADATGVLQIVLDEDPWGSTISFDAGIAVTRGGTLQLDFAADVNIGSQIGRTFKLFDWGGVTPTGSFTVSSLYQWDTSQLETTGEVTFAGTYETDFNEDGVVDGADFLQWQRNIGGPNSARDLANWKVNFGHVDEGPAMGAPEPGAAAVAIGLLAPAGNCRTQRRRRR